jgi:hypothetical protein
MSFLDKFNNWYVRSILETPEGATLRWLEPVAGARFRWQNGGYLNLLWLPAIFLGALVLPPKRANSNASFEERFWITLGIVVVMALVMWFRRGSRQWITLTPTHAIVGQGRRPHVNRFDGKRLFMEERDGNPVLMVQEPGGKTERLYLDPTKETEVRELLTKAGRL